MLDFENSFNTFDRNHDITDVDKDKFDYDVMYQWRVRHKKGRHKLPNEDDLATARRVLDDVREVRLKLRNEELDDYFSNGCFYSYSNIPLIGWLQNWTEKYSKDGQSIQQ